MSKYDKMVALNAERSKEKMEMAKKTIWDMVDKEEKVTIPKLMQKTRLSRGFFYKNQPSGESWTGQWSARWEWWIQDGASSTTPRISRSSGCRRQLQNRSRRLKVWNEKTQG